MNGYKEVCICGHHRETHFEDPRTGVRMRCLGLHCDECYRYRDALATCDDYRDTPRMFAAAPSHSVSCLCDDCLKIAGY